MYKFKGLDAINTIEKILREIKPSFERDFRQNQRALIRAGVYKAIEDKTILWLSCSEGTYCFNEKDMFINNSLYNHMRELLKSKQANDLLYLVDFVPYRHLEDIADLYQLNPDRYLNHIEKILLQPNKQKDIYDNSMDNNESKKCYHLDSKSSPISEKNCITFETSENEMISILGKERNYRSECNYTIGNIDQYISMLNKWKIERECLLVLSKFKELKKPNSENGDEFMVDLTSHFYTLATRKDRIALVSMLPFESAHFLCVKGKGTIQLAVKKDDYYKGMSQNLKNFNMLVYPVNGDNTKKTSKDKCLSD